MEQWRKVLALIAVAMCVLSACSDRSAVGDAPNRSTSAISSETGPDETSVQSPSGIVQGWETDGTYIGQLVQETIAEFMEPGMSEFEMTKAAFDYMVENTTLIDPVGLDLWRIRADDAELPSYVENRSLSILLFRVGKCEDYAAALTLLLQGMGLEAQYVPGLTYSTQGELVDHAWTVVKVDGVWYHLDCQLEQNISRNGSMRYKYFMRSDATMAGSHRWGQNLIDSRLLRAEQNEEIARSYIPPACPQDYSTPERRAVVLPGMPDMAAIETAIAEEFQQYEAVNGPLTSLEINIIPPVFALEGYGPQD